MQPSILTDMDLFLFNEGTHARLYERMGAHPMVRNGTPGVHFAVWAPNAEQVSVVGDFCRWDPAAVPLTAREHTGIWEGFVPGLGAGALYKYFIRSRWNGFTAEKSDPFAFATELPPRTASVVAELGGYDWGDQDWMRRRPERSALESPASIYEVHLGSWQRKNGQWLSYRELAPLLADYVSELGFTHVELMPVMEHPFYGSWGYQVTGYFAPTSRYGRPEDLMYLIDVLHQRGIGVILDWVPAHFPVDGHGLAYFDGTHLYEHADPRQGFHPDWKSAIFNYGRHEVRSFLMSSAAFWLDRYHVDGLRVDGVASMLYLDYSRASGEWVPNAYGGRENLEAIDCLRRVNEMVYRDYPGAITIAEESTAYPMVSRPTYVGGLGFGFKWDMGWMHDTLAYTAKDPIHRRYHHDKLTFRGLYAFQENFVLPLSHDEVVHGKGSLAGKMPGDDWQKHANLRLLFSYQWATPAKKLLFMGCELGTWREWNHEAPLEWFLLEHANHRGIQTLVKALNHLYGSRSALHQWDADPRGFEWIDCTDVDRSVYAFLRRDAQGKVVVAVFNFTPVPREGYRIGLPQGGRWRAILNSDDPVFGGSGAVSVDELAADPVAHHGRPFSLQLKLPPLGALWFEPADGK